MHTLKSDAVLFAACIVAVLTVLGSGQHPADWMGLLNALLHG